MRLQLSLIKIETYIFLIKIYIFMDYIKYLYYKYFCTGIEMRIIERTNSNETFVTYLSDSDIEEDI